jgi:hypothetical protein
MEQMTIFDILSDFNSVKLPKEKRDFVNNSRKILQETGGLPINIQDDLRRMARRYNRQLNELHASRERARRTNWKIREGISEDKARELVERRNKDISARKADLGI